MSEEVKPCNHDWESFGIVYDSYPIMGSWRCFKCKEEFWGRENDLPGQEQTFEEFTNGDR